MQASIFILFLDLVKAFDRVIREIVLGWPPSLSTTPRKYLESLGLDPEVADWIATYIEKHGCLLEQWGVDEKVTALLCAMHDGAWFKYGGLETAIITSTGAPGLQSRSDRLQLLL